MYIQTEVSVDDILESATENEKRYVLDELLKDRALQDHPAVRNAKRNEAKSFRRTVIAWIDQLTSGDKKRLLCDILNCPYHNTDALRLHLEDIISAD